MKFKGFLESYTGGYDDSVMIAEIDMTNFGDLKIPEYIKNYNGYIFFIKDVEFLFKGTHIESNKWIIKFGVHKGNGKLDIEMSGKHETKNTILVLKNVIKCMSLFTIRYKPEQLTFVADRKSRQLTYERIVEALLMRPEFQYYGTLDKKYSQTDKIVTYIIKKR
ncbi:MAG: hypothetical protein KQ78_02139 [Candidatus Izimaplasma bacterium HR2]|nr:MAG: hypothetical protein KQ78_02139 [Candidatus Izimaplasma bacterium HR2]